MKKAILGIVFITLLIFSAVPAYASNNSSKPITPKVLQAVFIHYEHPVKPSKPGTTLPEPVNDYYQPIGPAWDLSKYPAGIPFVINPSKAPAGAVSELKKAFETWDNASNQEVFNDSPVINYNSWWGNNDGKNNVSWQVLSSSSAIAATWIWYLDKDASNSMTLGDEVIENDIVFNASMRWGIDADGEGTSSKLKNMFDVCNIATHEIGHVIGLDDLYDLKYRELTMYGYGAKSETQKITLETGDINGTIALYP